MHEDDGGPAVELFPDREQAVVAEVDAFEVFFVATGSFFLGQQKVMPVFIQGSPVLIVLALAPLVLMVFWLFRVRLSRRFATVGAPT